jgi:hypothetical protein
MELGEVASILGLKSNALSAFALEIEKTQDNVMFKQM